MENENCPHVGAVIKNRKTTRPIYGSGRVINERVTVERTRVCPGCGAHELAPLVDLRTEIDPSWRPKQARRST